MLNNRELATLIWVAVVLVAASVHLLKDTSGRQKLRDAARASLVPVIVIALALLLAWGLLLVNLGACVDIWNRDLTSETVTWFIGSAIVLFFRVNTALKDDHFFRHVVVSTIGVTIFLEFALNFYVLDLTAEIALQGILGFLVLLSGVASLYAEHARLKYRMDQVIGFIAICLAIHVMYQFISEWRDIDAGAAIREFVLPIWLTLGLLPYLYSLSLYMAYEFAHTQLSHQSVAEAGRWRAMIALAIELRLRRRMVAHLDIVSARSAAAAPTLAASREVAKAYRRQFAARQG